MISPGAALDRISRAKNSLKSPDEYESEDTSFTGERYAAVYREYERRLRENNGLDFDDLIVKTIQLLEGDVETRTRWQNKFRYVLVDEYQDVNHAQYRLVKMLADEHKNITVVGDDDQSIYSWRGSDYRNILNFERDFPGAKKFKLEENYRSTQAVLRAANELVANNTSREPKTLISNKGEGDPVTVFLAETERAEARYAIEKIKELVRDGAVVQRHADPLPDQRAVPRVRRDAGQRRHSAQSGGRRRFLRPLGSQRRFGVLALHRQSGRQRFVQAHHQRSAPQHRPADRFQPRRCGPRGQHRGR